MFHELLTDIIVLYKADGRVLENVRARVSDNRVFVADAKLPVEAGDNLTRVLPSGLEDEFIVDDPGYQARVAGIPAHFQMKVHRAGTERRPLGSTTYNVTGPNARLNINSHDRSTNTVVHGNAPVFADLLKVVAESSVGDGERAKLVAGIEAMANAHTTPGFVDRYQDFIALAANHVAIIAPFIPALSALLPSK